MKSGLRGGKPRDMATMSHGGKTSRGAGAAQRGFQYNVYAKGGKVKKYAEGGRTRKEYGGTESMPEWDVPQYSFSDLFGKGKKALESKPDYSAGAVKREPLSSEESTGAGDRIRQEAMDREEASRKASRGDTELRSASTPRAREDLPTRPSGPQRRMARRAAGTEFLSTDPAVTGPARSRTPRPMTQAEREAEQPDLRPRVSARAQPTERSEMIPEFPRARPIFGDQGGGMSEADIMEASRRSQAPFTRIPRPREPEVMRILRRAVHGEERAREMEAQGYAKGGKVKMAGGGSCRGMGAAQRGGKYSVR